MSRIEVLLITVLVGVSGVVLILLLIVMSKMRLNEEVMSL